MLLRAGQYATSLGALALLVFRAAAEMVSFHPHDPGHRVAP